jgi:hypothetical protein
MNTLHPTDEQKVEIIRVIMSHGSQNDSEKAAPQIEAQNPNVADVTIENNEILDEFAKFVADEQTRTRVRVLAELLCKACSNHLVGSQQLIAYSLSACDSTYVAAMECFFSQLTKENHVEILKILCTFGSQSTIESFDFVLSKTVDMLLKK